jgi:hypothetical protein
LFDWLAVDGKSVASHATALPLEFFDEFSTYEFDDTASPQRLSAVACLGKDANAAVLDTSSVGGSMVERGGARGGGGGAADVVGSWRAATLTALRADGCFEGSFVGSGASFVAAPLRVAFDPIDTGGGGARYLARVMRRLGAALKV